MSGPPETAPDWSTHGGRGAQGVGARGARNEGARDRRRDGRPSTRHSGAASNRIRNLLSASLVGSLAAAASGLAVAAWSRLARRSGAADSGQSVPSAIVSGVLAALLWAAQRHGRRTEQRVARLHRRVGRLQNSVDALARAEPARFAELRAAASLSHLSDPYPLWFGGMALTAEAAAELVRQLHERRPARALETGSGVSTLLMGRYFADRGDGLVVALESDAQYAAETQRHADAMGVAQHVLILDAGLQPITLGAETHRWYSLDERITARLAEHAPYDLLLVDGPPQFVDPEGSPRYPALPLLEGWLSPSALVMVDDALRPGEARMLERWSRDLPGWRGRDARSQRGLRLLERAVEPVPAAVPAAVADA